MLPKTALEKQKLASLCCSHAAVAAGDDDVALELLAVVELYAVLRQLPSTT